MIADRNIRQRDLVPPATLQRYHVIVIGVGAIGRQVALQLAAMGTPVLTLIDDDVVAPENLAVQGYRESDLGRTKVAATAEACHALNGEIAVDLLPDRFTRSTVLPTQRDRLAIFACVDSMLGRRNIWQATHAKAAFVADGRMAGETLRVVASCDPPLDTDYPTTLFDDTRAHPAPCTGRSTLYAASIAAGLMLARFAMHLRDQPLPADTLLNLAANELVELTPERTSIG